MTLRELTDIPHEAEGLGGTQPRGAPREGCGSGEREAKDGRGLSAFLTTFAL